MRLVLKNNLSKIESEYQVTDVGDSSLFYHFEDLTLQENLPEGEYSYFLYDSDYNLVAQGLAQIGDYVPTTGDQKTYTTNNNTYKQYNG